MKNKIKGLLQNSLMRGALFAPAFGLPLLPILAYNAAAQQKQQEIKDKKVAPRLAGEWKLNAALSDDAKTKMQEMMKSGGGRPGGPPPGGMGGPPPGGGESFPDGEMPNREQMQAMRERMERSLAAPKSLQITQSDAEVTISETGDNDRTRSFYLDGRKNDSGETAGKAKFKKSQLIVESSPDRGPKIVETYELSEDGRQLIVIFKMENNFGGGGMKLRRVYDAAN